MGEDVGLYCQHVIDLFLEVVALLSSDQDIPGSLRVLVCGIDDDRGLAVS